MKARVANAIVKIRNLNTQKEYTSQPTDAKGNYKILMIEEGWYTMGVTTAAGDFNLNYGVYIKAGETAKLSVEMLPGGMLEGKGGNGGRRQEGVLRDPRRGPGHRRPRGRRGLRRLRADEERKKPRPSGKASLSPVRGPGGKKNP